jgi:hypothetical protein
MKFKRRDELEAEIEELKSRICEKCLYYKKFTYEIPGAEDFKNTGLGCAIMKRKVSETFGCNKWEKKQ